MHQQHSLCVRSAAHDYHVHEEEDETKQTNEDDMGDAAALLVMLYLLFISTLLVGAIVLGFVVVFQYGFVVLIAVCVAVFGMLIVAATVTSVITRDAKLRKARGKIKRCVQCALLISCVCVYAVFVHWPLMCTAYTSAHAKTVGTLHVKKRY